MADASDYIGGEAARNNDITNNHSSSSTTNDITNNPLPSAGMSEHIHHTVSDNNLKQWSILMEEKISCGGQTFWSRKNRIMLAPKILYDISPKSYTPQLLFVGPLTARSSMETNTLSTMDCCKAEIVNDFLGRCPPESQLHNLIAVLFQEPQNPGAIYFDIPNYFDEEVVKLIITIDSVCVLQLLYNPICYYICRPFMNYFTVPYMYRDLFIVGNQVPLSYLLRLAQYQGLPTERLIDSLERLIWGLSPFTPKDMDYSSEDFQKNVSVPLLQECEHLLDYLYQACVLNTREEVTSSNEVQESPINQTSKLCKVRVGWLHQACVKNTSEKRNSERIKKVPRASELHKVGVKFKAVGGNASAINYDEKNLIVELPKLVVYDLTECTLRNLLAYEHTSKIEDDLCSYIWLMDDLIDNIDDLHILYMAGVLENNLGSDEKLIEMWNGMCVNIMAPGEGRLVGMAQAILTHYDTNWRKLYVEFCRRYFSKPWYILSTLAALLLLVMTLLQTIYAAMGFYIS